MSERTWERRCWRSRDSEMEARRRLSSRLWSWSTSRWRERLFCLSADEVRADSESRRRVSCAIRASRWSELGCQRAVREREREKLIRIYSPCLIALVFVLLFAVLPPMAFAVDWTWRHTENIYGIVFLSSPYMVSCSCGKIATSLTWLSRLLACCRSCAHPVPVEADMVLEREWAMPPF